MSGYTARQLALAALAANALRPSRGPRGAIPSFAFGWLAGELAPQLLAATAVDTALAVRRGRATPVGLALAGAGAVGLATLVRGAMRSGASVEGVLSESLGEDYLAEPPSAADLAIPFRSVARPFRLTDPDVVVERDITYTPGGRRARLDVYRPRDRDLRDAPVLIQVHGGAWTIGSKEQQGLLLMNRMAKRGWVCVAINYRLAPKHPWPAQIVDTKRAIAWVREHIASYGGDPGHLVLTGGSAGGHLAALAALTPHEKRFQPGFEDADTSVAACVPFYGVYDMAGLTGSHDAVAMRDGFLAEKIFQLDPRTHLADFELASPLAHVDAAERDGRTPDFFVLHGTHDTLVPIGQARAFVEKLRSTDASVTYAELAGAQHAFEVFSSIRSQHVVRAVQRWLEWQHAHAQRSSSLTG